jgi:hypothetical protein
MNSKPFDNSNIQPTVNPKPLNVERIENRPTDKEGNPTGDTEILLVKNSKVNPYELLKR